MTRNVAVSAVVLSFMLAFNGAAVAGPGGSNPFDAILGSLESIRKQEAQANSQILLQLQDIQRRLDKLEASQRPAPSAHRVWVAPFWHDTITGTATDGAHIWRGGHVFALNPGSIEASVRVLYVNYFTHGRQVLRDTASTGDRTRDLASDVDGQFTTHAGWVIVASDRPVLPYGWFTVGDGGQDDRNDLSIRFYPIDCTNPADDTVSRACYYADPANDPPGN